jgi:V/A-type H+-transporting ATPase subunit E
MRSVEENILALTRAVLNEANTEAEKILAEAREKAEGMRQQAQQQASAERAKILGQASKEANLLRSQAITSAKLQARASEMEHREKLLDSVFEEARQQSPGIQQRDDYNQIVLQLLQEALIHLGADTASVRADELTQTYLTEQALDEVSAELGVQLQIGPSLEQGVGLIAQTADGHRQYDNTLEARLDRLRNALRAPVLQLLMGEAL